MEELRKKILEAVLALPLRVELLSQLLATRWGSDARRVKNEVLRMIDEGVLIVGDDYLVQVEGPRTEHGGGIREQPRLERNTMTKSKLDEYEVAVAAADVALLTRPEDMVHQETWTMLRAAYEAERAERRRLEGYRFRVSQLMSRIRELEEGQSGGLPDGDS